MLAWVIADVLGWFGLEGGGMWEAEIRKPSLFWATIHAVKSFTLRALAIKLFQ